MTEKDCEMLWARAREQLDASMPTNADWFKEASFGGAEGTSVTLNVKNKFILSKFEEELKPFIENTMSELAGEAVTVVFSVAKKDEKASSGTKPAVAEVSHTESSKAPQRPAGCTLNPSYTFDSFVMGDNSSFAYNACLAISKNPGTAYNPCLIYGGVGLGKTHLLQSIGNSILAENPKAKVQYVTSENYTNEFITALGNKTTAAFKNKYRKVSVLLIDDIHFLQGKTSVQEELFNTFNDLYDTGRQIVFTCDRPVEELKDISDRLRSRFSRGLNIDLQPPAFETRVAILRKKCEEKGFPMSSDVIDFIAENVSSNVRDLESCVTKLYAYNNLLHKDITLETAKEQLKQIIVVNRPADIQIDTVVRSVASFYNVTPSEIKGKSKSKSIVTARQIAMYLCRKLTDFSTSEIGLEFDGKNHTTVMYNVSKVESMMNSENSDDIRNAVEKIQKQILEETKKRR